MKTQLDTTSISTIAAISILQTAHNVRANLSAEASPEQIADPVESALALVKLIGADGRWHLLSTDRNIISPTHTFVAVADGQLYLMVKAGKNIGYSTIYHALAWDGAVLTADFDEPVGPDDRRSSLTQSRG